MVHLAFAAALAASALFFALLEVQIERPNGWARQLPTWRIDNRWTRLVFSSRPVTGYHLYVHLFLLVVLHLPYALGFTVPSWAAEARIAAFWIGFWILEDYLRFVFNPAFGASHFRRKHIWWHAPAWWWIMPREHWLGAPIALALYLLSWH